MPIFFRFVGPVEFAMRSSLGEDSRYGKLVRTLDEGLTKASSNELPPLLVTRFEQDCFATHFPIALAGTAKAPRRCAWLGLNRVPIFLPTPAATPSIVSLTGGRQLLIHVRPRPLAIPAQIRFVQCFHIDHVSPPVVSVGRIFLAASVPP